MNIGPWQIVLILLLALLLFGGKKLPELMKGLGKGIREFKDASNEDDDANSKKNKVEDKKES
ncbi:MULTISPECIES: twin-arginine translocase TatA/TatE family subunit [Salibacter]|jgi:sec-independent protein translocase protein TatA|uniref:Sec-independent protein translocase protein TatA n=1 Tax=Salibacter halophilus TaxID=1803916 RepID=A0A6N6M3Z7_9FLAO|nr:MULTISPECIES: twin-arginine translocase TatA/TatE family subunit [Salibacter]KAB1063914.1 twin-arginine translocase TatA/TatE family subunit [Salibacter halophilus]MDR9397429.1 twin-arginine translocase TatA/TatE family subunit [Salibacter sp.]MDR9486663.1 twin-arginine translocase TatA/TatE family subunit [Salibacter sp.]